VQPVLREAFQLALKNLQIDIDPAKKPGRPGSVSNIPLSYIDLLNINEL
jgi:hypothetical protein